ncbi:hypothetical protein QQX98_009278 [Neonectria punicea]|uniref:C6 zinc finger domain protein n=1 Tax=Neonectria punicea TaxID=979145 RepID=A0ABR1GST2_9HYPO
MTVSHDEGRALQYFCSTAGPSLSRVTDRYFWTHLVMQFTSFEPAVRHSVVAISLLYQQLPHGLQQDSDTPHQSLILTNYNAAIRELKSMSTLEKQPLVLLVCVLFICIEFLQSNWTGAIQHCKHGIMMLASSTAENNWTRSYLVPVFRRLSLFPFFFGVGEADYPSLSALTSPAPHRFHSFDDARYMMDDIYSQVLCFERLGDEYRIGSDKPVPTEVQDRQTFLNSLLDTWQASFIKLHATLPKPDSSAAVRSQLTSQHFLSVRFDVCRIMANTAFESGEMCYDRYIETFKSISERLAFCIPTNSKIRDAGRPKFTFEMGFMPVLCFSVIKCRHLETRLRLWRLMPILGCPRESLWQLNMMTPVLRRVIEVEHGTRFDKSGECVNPIDLPPDDMRARHLQADPYLTCRAVRGRDVVGRVLEMWMPEKDGSVSLRKEFAQSL